MDYEDEAGIWPLPPFGGGLGEGNPVNLEIPEGERVWVVNYCPPCRALFVDRATPVDEACKEYLRSVAEQLGMRFDGKGGSAAKAPFVEAVVDRIARRRPAP